MQPNRVKQILREGGLALGTYVGGIAIRRSSRSSATPGSTPPSSTWSTPASTCARCSSWSWPPAGGITPIVRTPRIRSGVHPAVARHGVQGIQLPHIGDARAAREAVKAVRYAPVGERGMAGASRASDYGKIAVKEHIERSNREITLAVMIEDLPALEEIDAIASTDASTSWRSGRPTCRGRWA